MSGNSLAGPDGSPLPGHGQFHPHTHHASAFAIPPSSYGMIPQMLAGPPGYIPHMQTYPRFLPMLTTGGTPSMAVGAASSPGNPLVGVGGVLAHPSVSGNGLPISSHAGAGASGPASRYEREAIARRMAALDYEDSSEGGKHREQWQAIAQHLLKEYQFTDATDRQTSKDYVRLCVLKDELRSSSRVRITVNHVKGLFRILNLTVTGEWDRRGHGGVRGPYVYGLASRTQTQ